MMIRGTNNENFKLTKIITSLLLIVLATVLNPIGASAEWKQNYGEWWYKQGNTYSIGWDKIDGDWYYFNNDGIMVTGWINDNSTYYYLNYNGSLDESKTTNIMPDEIQTIYNIVDIYNDSGILKYISKGYINKLELSDKSLYKFYSENQLGNEISEYYYDLSNGNVYKLEQGIVTLLNTNTIINNTNPSITITEAVDKVKDYLFENGKQIPNKIKVESDDGSKYVVHCYNNSDSYNSISDWYYVDKYTGNVTSMY